MFVETLYADSCDHAAGSLHRSIGFGVGHVGPLPARPSQLKRPNPFAKRMDSLGIRGKIGIAYPQKSHAPIRQKTNFFDNIGNAPLANRSIILGIDTEGTSSIATAAGYDAGGIFGSFVTNGAQQATHFRGGRSRIF